MKCQQINTGICEKRCDTNEAKDCTRCRDCPNKSKSTATNETTLAYSHTNQKVCVVHEMFYSMFGLEIRFPGDNIPKNVRHLMNHIP
ncbi:hypothetical protein Ahy_B06g085171 isoform B [Arachis hypogaea]|uniref:Uncharacterized protein n=1 Tax=Arachis hypogaea TaxID=3818 RepID=A0A444YTP3_ARAHY|nr:hypothetical protein Ahy_B06g085171 isoform B [Arachis hypogaea]